MKLSIFFLITGLSIASSVELVAMGGIITRMNARINSRRSLSKYKQRVGELPKDGTTDPFVLFSERKKINIFPPMPDNHKQYTNVCNKPFCLQLDPIEFYYYDRKPFSDLIKRYKEKRSLSPASRVDLVYSDRSSTTVFNSQDRCITLSDKYIPFINAVEHKPKN